MADQQLLDFIAGFDLSPPSKTIPRDSDPSYVMHDLKYSIKRLPKEQML
jgi:hypothetical protein